MKMNEMGLSGLESIFELLLISRIDIYVTALCVQDRKELIIMKVQFRIWMERGLFEERTCKSRIAAVKL